MPKTLMSGSKTRLIDRTLINQDKDDVRHRGAQSSSFKSKLLSLIFSALVSGDCGNVKLGDARFVSVASPEVLNMANSVDDVDDQFASFLLDSGAAAHCCFEKARFKAIRYGHFGCVKVANGTLVPIMACGDVDVDIGGQVITLKNVMYVPDLKFNVISVKKLWKDNRIETTFGDRCYLKDTTHGNKKYYFPGQNGSLYKVGVVSTAKISESLLHRRLGHCGINKLRGSGLSGHA